MQEPIIEEESNKAEDKVNPEEMLERLGYKIEWDKKVNEISIVKPVQILLHIPLAESINKPSDAPSISLEEMLKQSFLKEHAMKLKNDINKEENNEGTVSNYPQQVMLAN